MIKSNNSFSQMNAEDVNEIHSDDFCKAFRQRSDTLTLVSQLNHLIKAVQKHRGMSMAMLGGNSAFVGEFEVLQKQLEKRLATLETFARETGGILSEKDKENLHLAWQTIRHNWEDDKVNDNFALHSHFVEQLHGMTYSLAKQLERPLASELIEQGDAAQQSQKSVTYPRMFKKIELLNFVAKQLPEMIERLAQVRGLSTYAAATGEVNYESDRKMRYLMQ